MQAKPYQSWILLFLTCFSVFLISLYHSPVPTVDGSIRADEAREIVRSQKWFPIQSHSEIVTDHPPLYVWSLATSFHIFGINDFAANLPERIFACLCLLVTFLITLHLTNDRVTSILSVLILISTRDFVLSSVRGYIESMLTFFSYFALWLALKNNAKTAVLSGMMIFFAAFAKGPPALWPFVFIVMYYFLNKSYKNIIYLIFGSLACIFLFSIWNSLNGFWPFWKKYLVDQVLNSAMRGRDGAQMFEPYYFIHILWVYYWPWLIFLISAILFNLFKFTQSSKDWIVLVFGLGFFAGFSLVKWKFWYYISPSYPAFAIFISMFLMKVWRVQITKLIQFKYFLILNTLWILIVVVFQIPLFYERVPSVHTFKNDILRSNKSMNVYMIHSFLDHNMVGTSGKWYFDRPVLKINDEDEKKWIEKSLLNDSWIITSVRHFNYCNTDRAPPEMRYWCKKSVLTSQDGDVALVKFTY